MHNHDNSGNTRFKLRLRVVVVTVLAVALFCSGMAGIGSGDGAVYAAGVSQKDLPVGALARIDGKSAWGNGYYHDGSHSANPDEAYLYADSQGMLNIVKVDIKKQKFTIGKYDASGKKLSSRSRSYSGWKYWGGFYAAPDGYLYVLVGNDNLNENDAKNVIEIRKYAADWSLVATGHLKGSAYQVFKGIYIPFLAGRADMTMVGQSLIVHTARQMYMISDGLRHQTNMTFEVDTNTMATQTIDEKYGVSHYVGHSFNQFVRFDGQNLITADHGDGYPRSLQLGVAKDFAQGNGDLVEYPMFNFIGKIGNNYTGTTLTGFEVGNGKVLLTGNSVPHNNPVRGVTGDSHKYMRNIYFISADIASADSSSINSWSSEGTIQYQFQWLTLFSPNGKTNALEPRLVKISDNEFVILYSTKTGDKYKLCYRLVDATGRELAAREWDNMYFDASSEPILSGGRLYWTSFASNKIWSMSNYIIDEDDSNLYLYALDLSAPGSPSLTGQKASNNAYLKKLSGSKGFVYSKGKYKEKRYRMKEIFKKNRYTYHQNAPANQPFAITAFAPAAEFTTVDVKQGSGKWKRNTSGAIETKIAKGKKKTIQIRVTAQDGKTKHTYKVIIKRAK
jgi:hypothetical protein